MTHNAENPPGKFPLRAVLIAVVLLPTVAVFAFSLSCTFVWDDEFYIHRNPIIKSITAENLYKMVKGEQSPTWHPLAWLSHAVDYRLYRLNPVGHHLTNLILHALATLSVFYLFTLLLRTALRRPSHAAVLTGAALGALLFAIHPLRVESVAWVAERKGLLAGLFFFLSLTAWMRYTQTTGNTRRRRRFHYAASLTFFLLALMSKPTVVMLPVVLLILDVFLLQRFRTGRTGRILLEKVPFFVLSLAVGLLELRTEAAGNTLTSLHIMSLGDRVVHVVRSLAFYVEKTLFPIQLVPFYPIPKDTSLAGVAFLSALALVVGLTAAALRQWRNGRPLWLGVWVYYLVVGLPIISIIHAGRHLMADRYSYLPTLSFYFLAAVGITKLLDGKRFARSTLAGVVLIIVLFASLSIREINVWSTPFVFWRHVMNAYPSQVVLAYNNLGIIFLNQGLMDEAEKKFKSAVAIEPDMALPRMNLGGLYITAHRWREAEVELNRAIELKPKNPPAYHNLGVLYFKQGLWKKAEARLKTALDMQPTYYAAYHTLGLLYEKQGKVEQAVAAMEMALKINPDFENALVDLIRIFRENASAKTNQRENGYE